MLRRVLCQLPSLQPSTSLVPSSFGSQLPSLLQARPLHQLHLRPGARRHREHLQRWSKRFPVLVSSRLSDALSSAAPPDPAGERSFDIFSRLLRERIVMINGPIDENTSSVVVAQLLFLESENPDQPISMYISSPGGHVVAGLGIYDTMQYIRNPVHTICVGHASSMASLLLCAGEPGHRSSLPNARIMLHQPSGGFEGQATDIGIRAKEMALTRKRLAEIYVQHTGQDFDTIERTLERDSFKSAAEAAAFGLIDKVLDRRPAAEEGS